MKTGTLQWEKGFPVMKIGFFSVGIDLQGVTWEPCMVWVCSVQTIQSGRLLKVISNRTLTEGFSRIPFFRGRYHEIEILHLFLMPWPFIGPKIFWTNPKSFGWVQKYFLELNYAFWSIFKIFWTSPKQNHFGPIEGQGIIFYEPYS